MTIIFCFIAIIITVLTLLWVNGIDYMDKNHPDQKVDDFFDKDIEQDDKTNKDK